MKITDEKVCIHQDISEDLKVDGRPFSQCFFFGGIYGGSNEVKINLVRHHINLSKTKVVRKCHLSYIYLIF